MAEHVIIKVYGHIWPCNKSDFESLKPIMPFSEQDILFFENDMLRISYEGMYFPLDDVIDVIANLLHPKSQGKLDYIDLEEWTLNRHEIKGKHINSKTISLNQALDYSGF